jgi:hypothetical protein
MAAPGVAVEKPPRTSRHEASTERRLIISHPRSWIGPFASRHITQDDPARKANDVAVRNRSAKGYRRTGATLSQTKIRVEIYALQSVESAAACPPAAA